LQIPAKGSDPIIEYELNALIGELMMFMGPPKGI
jgi:hypothetical protein